MTKRVVLVTGLPASLEVGLDNLNAYSRFDALIHLAAMAGVRASVEDPEYYSISTWGGER